MHIFYSLSSPYARKVTLLAELAGFDQIEWLLVKAQDTPRSLNPLGKIPVMVNDDFTLFDSALICDYLDDLHRQDGGESFFKKGTDDYYRLQKYHFLANGLMDAAVATVMENRREAAQQSSHWLGRWRSAMESAIAAMPVAILGEDRTINIAGISTAAALGYVAFRLPEVNIAQLNPSLYAWFSALNQQPWFAASTPKD